jgi:predicted O-linked N-acetylglucosamine transferase (SPINDLY family)
LRVARAWSRHTLPRVAAPGPAPVRSLGSRLRIGYLSSDLHDHATARLMVELFERHDKARTEIIAYSCGPDDGSPMRTRLRHAFDHWVEIANDDVAAARRIRDDGIDVLVDLKGHTKDNRLGIACRRPAPVQIHYLGYPGTLGLDAISHLVADAITIPPGEESSYHETVVRLPRCYQVNDSRRPLPAALPRAALGLSEEAIVLACFNQTYKLSREFLRLWARAMHEVPRSVLWLYVPNETAQRNLRREALREGLDSSRLVFAPTVTADAHIARLRAADLALDVLPVGSHTTGSDALWAGVPMLTCRGHTFAGRVGASLLDAVGLQELVTPSMEAYGETLAELLREPERLRACRNHLEVNRYRLPLFDAEGFTRDWERMLEHLATRP